MAEVILMPRFYDTMNEGVIFALSKNVGDWVRKGDDLAYIDTEKGTKVFQSSHNGVLLYIGTSKGSTFYIDDIYGIIGYSGEDINELLSEYLIDNQGVYPKIYEQPIKKLIYLPSELLSIRTSSYDHLESINWYKIESESFVPGDKFFDIRIDKKVYTIGVNFYGTLIEKKFPSENGICNVMCLVSEFSSEKAPLYIISSFMVLKELEEHKYFNYTIDQLDLYERLLDIELKAAKISHSELEINDSSLKQQSLIKKEKEKEEKEKEYRGWLILIILSPFIIYFIIRLFGFNVGEIFITGIFSASILAVGFSKKF
jgi:hypothetical protein